MIAYVLLASAVVACGAGAERTKTGSSSTFRFWALTAVALLVLASRQGIGTDWRLYESRYVRFQPYSALADYVQLADQETGFVVLQFFAQRVGLSFWQFAALVSVITVVLTALAIRKLAPEGKVLALALFISVGPFLASFNTIRQSLAAAVLILGVSFAGRSRAPMLICGLLAVTLHSSALLPLALFGVLSFGSKLSWRSFFLAAAVAAGVAAWLGPRFLDEAAFARYSEYFTNDLDTAGAGLGSLFLVALRLTTVFLLFNLAKTSDMSSEQARWFLRVALLSLFFSTAAFISVPIARFDYYFSPVALAGCALVISTQRQSGRSFWLRTSALGVGVVALIVSSRYLHGIFPYAGLWDQ